MKEARTFRRDLDRHLKDKCPNRQYECPHCKDTGRHCYITTTHLDTCPKLQVPCPNSECKDSLLRCNLSSHRLTCHYEKVPCKYAGIGCKEKPFRNGLEEHENDDKFHLHLAIETVNEQQKEMKKQQKKINKQREEINKQKKEINKQQEEVKVMSEKVRAGQAGPCVVKMPQYYRHKTSSQEWYSPPFYTSPGGYKMCIKVDANGNGDAAGTHVSVFFRMMKGRNDDNLAWPFTGEVIITLLNQLADKNHHSRTTSFSKGNDMCRRVVDSEMAPTGYGQPKFIPHDRLDAKWNHQYLMDDCLYFQIEVQTAKPEKLWLACNV